eukprot:7507830-Pyramimonas_sp.AAC.1
MFSLFLNIPPVWDIPDLRQMVSHSPVSHRHGQPVRVDLKGNRVGPRHPPWLSRRLLSDCLPPDHHAPTGTPFEAIWSCALHTIDLSNHLKGCAEGVR